MLAAVGVQGVGAADKSSLLSRWLSPELALVFRAYWMQSNENVQLKESMAAAANSHALEKESLEKRLEQSAADAERQRGQLQEMLDTKSTELARMWEQHDRSQEKLASMQARLCCSLPLRTVSWLPVCADAAFNLLLVFGTRSLRSTNSGEWQRLNKTR